MSRAKLKAAPELAAGRRQITQHITITAEDSRTNPTRPQSAPPPSRGNGPAGLPVWSTLYGEPGGVCESCGIPLDAPEGDMLRRGILCQQCLAWSHHRRHTLAAKSALEG